MRISSNRLSELRSFYFRELSALYTRNEIAELFVQAAMSYLNWNRSQVHTRLEQNLNQSEMLLIYDCAKELAGGKPLQYILKEAWFFGLKFKVNPSVLIPRPETEELVQLVLKYFTENSGHLLDIGSGSGCIPISIKKNRPALEVSACDVSPAALTLATENAKTNKVSINFFHCDILKGELTTTYDVIVSNPPYILPAERDNMEDQVLKHEPELALFTPQEQPVLFYEKIIELSVKHLKPGGRLFFELNPQTASQVLDKIIETDRFNHQELIHDISGKVRFLYAQRK